MLQAGHRILTQIGQNTHMGSPAHRGGEQIACDNSGHQFNDGHGGAVTGPGTEAYYSCVTSIASVELWADIRKELFDGGVIPEDGGGLPARIDILPLAEGDEFFHNRSQRLCLGNRCGDSSMIYQSNGKVGHQRLTVRAFTAQLTFFLSMSHFGLRLLAFMRIKKPQSSNETSLPTGSGLESSENAPILFFPLIG